jgi:hypothetical protein
MSEAFGFTVYQRDGRLFVDPKVMSAIGLQGLNEVIEVARLEELEPALEAAEGRARAAQARGEKERFTDGAPVWEVAGCKSWVRFVPKTTAVGVLRLKGETRLELRRPQPEGGAMTATGAERILSADASFAEIAEAVRALLATTPIAAGAKNGSK